MAFTSTGSHHAECSVGETVPKRRLTLVIVLVRLAPLGCRTGATAHGQVCPLRIGSKYGFVQKEGAVSQTFTADGSGIFSLLWLEAARPQTDGADGTRLTTSLLAGFDLGTFSTTSGQPFTARHSYTPGLY